MARNQEKANAMLNRFWAAKRGQTDTRRPYTANGINKINDAEKWRQQIVKEIAKKVSEIQNPAMDEHRVRDLNDNINKLIREKAHWERRIIDLGGPDYSMSAPPIGDAGVSIGGAYKYFGAAKDLPGVKELFQKDVEDEGKKLRTQLYKGIDADYYGFKDDEDGVLIPLEEAAERKAVEDAVRDFEKNREEKLSHLPRSVRNKILQEQREQQMAAAAAATPMEIELDPAFRMHSDVPTQKDVEKALVDRRKKELLAKYASEDLVMQEAESKNMLNIRS